MVSMIVKYGGKVLFCIVLDGINIFYELNIVLFDVL